MRSFSTSEPGPQGKRRRATPRGRQGRGVRQRVGALVLMKAGDSTQAGCTAARAVSGDPVMQALNPRAEEGHDGDQGFLPALVRRLRKDVRRPHASADHVPGLGGDRARDVRGKVMQPGAATSPAPRRGPCATGRFPRVLNEDDESLVAKIEIIDRDADEPLDLSVAVTAEVTDGEPPGLHRRACFGLSIVVMGTTVGRGSGTWRIDHLLSESGLRRILALALTSSRTTLCERPSTTAPALFRARSAGELSAAAQTRGRTGPER